MKKIGVVFAMLGFVATTSFAQKLKANEVPVAVKTAFAKSHAAITKVSWLKEADTGYEAEFTLNGKETSEIYTVKGVLVETEVEIKVAELPGAVKMKLKDKKIAEAAKITRANGTIVYEAEVNGKELLFDAKGNTVNL